MAKAAPDFVLCATRDALAGCGPDHALSEQVAEAKAVAAHAESARKAAESPLKRLATQALPAAPTEAAPVIDGNEDTAGPDAPMDTTDPALPPEQDASE